jgi:hypothetical protein
LVPTSFNNGLPFSPISCFGLVLVLAVLFQNGYSKIRRGGAKSQFAPFRCKAIKRLSPSRRKPEPIQKAPTVERAIFDDFFFLAGFSFCRLPAVFRFRA